MKSQIIRGKVWKFGDDINTDIISPGEYMDASYEEIGKHAMERAYPGFANAIEKGDIIVAGKNFGPGSSRETLLVLDATTGQNGLIQAKEFSKTAGVTGIVLTKLDGTAKGGIVIAIAKELGVPVKFAGVGEGVDDLQPFDAREFTQALL